MKVHHYHRREGKLLICGEPSCSPSPDKTVAQWMDVIDPEGGIHHVRPLSGEIAGFEKVLDIWRVREVPIPIVEQ